MLATRLILPDYIVSGFVPPQVCRRCGRSDLSFKLLFPQLHWSRTDIELIYPLRCPCGGSGCVPIKLPTLMFGFILANVALIDTANRRRSKATMTVSPHRGDLLEKMFSDFDQLMADVATSTLRTPLVAENEQLSLSDNDAERIKFGFDKDDWKDFLRRLGLDGPSAD